MALPSIGRGRSYINLVNQRHLKHWRVGRPSTLVSENVLGFFLCSYERSSYKTKFCLCGPSLSVLFTAKV